MLLDFSRTLVPRIDALWEARKQEKYIEENSLDADLITLRALHRKCKPFSPRPIKEHKVFCGVHPGHVPGVYTLERSPAEHHS